MRTYDLSPLYRFSVGFDRMNRLFDAVARWDETAAAYPPYDIVKTGEDAYRISMAVAGFGEDELEVSVDENRLTVSGHKDAPDGEPAFLHHGIAARTFERTFELADYIRVESAHLSDGLLNIDLVREIPEAMKPRTIAIETGASAKVVDQKKAA